MYLKEYDRLNGMCNPCLYLYDELLSIPNRDRMQNLRPREVDVSNMPIGAHKPFGNSSSGVKVLDV
jgi:hypothetical protein